MNIEEILTKYAKEGDKFYSPVYGEVEFLQCCKGYEFPIRVLDAKGIWHMFSPEGYIYSKFHDSECVLFPSANQRDWNQYLQEHGGRFKVGDHISFCNKQYYIRDILEDSLDGKDFCIAPVIDEKIVSIWLSLEEIKRCDHFDPKPLEHYDKIIGWNESMGRWVIDFFQFIIEDVTHKYVGMANSYTWVIPYNEETESLVGTANDLPDFYRENED